MTADAAAKSIRKVDPDGSIVVVSQESAPPYKRPPLSKGLWRGDDQSRIDLGTTAAGAELLLGRRAEQLDLPTRSVTLDDGSKIGYDRLLLATGARARTLPQLPESDRIIAYRTKDDFHRVRELARDASSAAVIGGGFIGSEMAAALRLAGVDVTMIFPEAAIGGGRFPDGLARRIGEEYQERGVRLLAGRTVARTEQHGDGVKLELDDGTVVPAAFVVVGVGAVANDELARSAGLRTDNGILVDLYLRALPAAPGQGPDGVYAAGDVASFEWAALGRRMRIEHEDNAYGMGVAAGRNMARSLVEGGAGTPARGYDHLPFFYSDLFDAGYEAVGLLDPRLGMVEDWRTPDEGVVYYLEDGLVRGVLLWNTWGQVDAARDLIESGVAYTPQELMGRLPSDD